MHLLKKGKKSLITMVFSRTGLITLLLLLQFGILMGLFAKFQQWIPHVYGLSAVLAGGMVIYLINSRLEPSAKLTWMVLVMVLPVFGTLFYLYAHLDLGHRMLKNRLSEIHQESRKQIPQAPEVMQTFREEHPQGASLSQYVRRSGCYPVYDNTEVHYFRSGEEKFQRLIYELEQAEKFIFLEYFIVEEGVMWGEVLSILAQKAREGLDVRIMYDGTCEFALLPKSYPVQLEALGIQCKVFSPVAPLVSTHYNYRDHRKIVVIDGHTAFTGGVNLADEYINLKERFGHWKDTALMLRGDAVQSFTLMFLQMWAIDQEKPEFRKFLSVRPRNPEYPSGYIMPYGDSPLDDERVGECVYMDLLNRAQRYVHIMTPYLIIGSEMENALCFAAKRGVDVRLILPGIPDKKIPYTLAKTHFSTLIRAGVKIYLYTPGFIHAKSFVCDDVEAVVGTINLDYRSLYHHFECAVYLYKADAIEQIENDFRETLGKCSRVTRETIRQEPKLIRAAGYLLKILAPLL